MIVYDLCCTPQAHRFEGWFASSADYAEQAARGLVTCPVCGTAAVTRAPTAPNLGRKSNQQAPAPVPATTPAPVAAPQPAQPALPPAALAALQAMAQMQAEALKSSTWVGSRFAEKARAMHYGETDPAPIHGQTSPAEAAALIDEGVTIAPILFPLIPPGTAN